MTLDEAKAMRFGQEAYADLRNAYARYGQGPEAIRASEVEAMALWFAYCTDPVARRGESTGEAWAAEEALKRLRALRGETSVEATPQSETPPDQGGVSINAKQV